jgi:hypothetical protein
MNLIVIALMYGLLLYVVLGGFLLTLCTDYPRFLKDYRLELMQAYGQNYLKTVLVLLYWYVIGLAIWPYWVAKHRS